MSSSVLSKNMPEKRSVSCSFFRESLHLHVYIVERRADNSLQGANSHQIRQGSETGHDGGWEVREDKSESNS